MVGILRCRMIRISTMWVALCWPLASLAAGDIKRGGDVFATECSECHSTKPGKNKKGPSLFEALNRPAGAISDFAYSDAMKKSGITWTPEKLQAYLLAPKKAVPGGKMKYDGLDPAEFADLLAYLSTLK